MNYIQRLGNVWEKKNPKIPNQTSRSLSCSHSQPPTRSLCSHTLSSLFSPVTTQWLTSLVLVVCSVSVRVLTMQPNQIAHSYNPTCVQAYKWLNRTKRKGIQMNPFSLRLTLNGIRVITIYPFPIAFCPSPRVCITAWVPIA